MKCMYAQTRPRFILSSEGVLGGMEFEPMLTPREKSTLPKMSPEEDRTRDAHELFQQLSAVCSSEGCIGNTMCGWTVAAGTPTITNTLPSLLSHPQHSNSQKVIPPLPQPLFLLLPLTLSLRGLFNLRCHHSLKKRTSHLSNLKLLHPLEVFSVGSDAKFKPPTPILKRPLVVGFRQAGQL